jgi:threonine dehydrogenase-like Zn-dependent dehydrogenase
VAAERPLRLPAGCPPEAALLAHLATISLNGVRQAHPQLGEGMLVYGQGLIGALAARFGRVAGCRPVVGVDPLPDRRRLAAAAGITPVDPEVADPLAVYRDLAEGRLPEIVIEATGASAVIPPALHAAAEMGRVVLLGSPRGRIEIDPYTEIHSKGVVVIGAHARTAPRVATPSHPFTVERNRRVALGLILDGSLPIEGLVSHHVTPEEVPPTYQALARRAAGYMGVVIDWTRRSSEQ